MKLPIAKIAASMLLLLGILSQTVQSLDMVVQVTVAPKVTTKLPLCSLPLLELLQPLLTLWVTQATVSVIPDFEMIGGLVLTYRNPSTGRMRMLRADNQDAELRLLARKKTATKTSSGSCSSCSSSGCSQYCGNGSCNMCGSSRRLLEDITSTDNTDVAREGTAGKARELAQADFNMLGVQVSATVQSSLQSFLLSSLFNLLGCLGDPLQLTTTVSFLANQTFVQ